MMTPRGTVLVVRHVRWEGPHRLGQILERRFGVIERCALDGDELPPVDAVDAAVFMGGPMNVDQVDLYQGLAEERAWSADAIERDLPLLGICLGSQLIARALGADVRCADEPEIGWAPVVVLDPKDPLLGPLASDTVVLHWHQDVFDLPQGAKPLARSAQTKYQAFRYRNAWAVLFHPEADRELVAQWLAQPVMAAEVPDGGDWDYDSAELVGRSRRGFESFAALIESATANRQPG